MKDINNRTLFLTLLIILAVLARLLPHPHNFTPLGALALFGGASFADRRLAVLAPLLAMLISDLFLGVHGLLPVVYGCLLINVWLGCWAGDKLNISRLVPASLLGSVLFFLGTNLGQWVIYHDWTWQGLATCFTMAIPFFQNTLAGDLMYGTILFGALAVAQARFPALKPATAQAQTSLA